MKITRNQLRKLISEAINEAIYGGPNRQGLKRKDFIRRSMTRDPIANAPPEYRETLRDIASQNEDDGISQAWALADSLT